MKVTARSDETIVVTINELLSVMGTDDRLMVGGFAKALAFAGVAKELDKRPSANGKGKPSIVYEIPKSFTLELGAISAIKSTSTNITTDDQITEAVASS